MNYVGPYEIIRRVHGNVYELAHEVDGTVRQEDAAKFIVRAKTALRFELGQTNVRFAQALYRRGDKVLYCPTNLTWFLVAVLADSGDDQVSVHFLNVDPKGHRKSVREIALEKRKFQFVWVSETDADAGERYADDQPEGYAPFTRSVARRRLRLQGRINVNALGKITQDYARDAHSDDGVC